MEFGWPTRRQFVFRSVVIAWNWFLCPARPCFSLDGAIALLLLISTWLRCRRSALMNRSASQLHSPAARGSSFCPKRKLFHLRLLWNNWKRATERRQRARRTKASNWTSSVVNIRFKSRYADETVDAEELATNTQPQRAGKTNIVNIYSFFSSLFGMKCKFAAVSFGLCSHFETLKCSIYRIHRAHSRYKSRSLRSIVCYNEQIDFIFWPDSASIDSLSRPSVSLFGATAAVTRTGRRSERRVNSFCRAR